VSPTVGDIRHVPKVLLHDHLDGGHLDGGHLDGGHLDGGLWPETIVHLARERGYGRLPAGDPAGLTEWMAWTRSCRRVRAVRRTAPDHRHRDQAWLAAFGPRMSVHVGRPADVRRR